MAGMIRMLSLDVFGMMVAMPSSDAADIDRTAVDFTTPSEIKWVRNAAGTNEHGAKGEETVIQVWGMGPATSTPFDRR